jgi:2-polyprenyl-3-methyl-5-hydroxy-6-metoxy-1,4-benzoquinol methylase
MQHSLSTFDAEVAEGFGEHLLGMINAGSLCVMLSIGHRTGLLDTIAGLPPSTSAEIADAAGLDERYVREWLGALVTGRIVEYDPAAGVYSLPPEHAALLTRDGALGNVAAFTQYVPMMGIVEDDIVDCFHNGGGVPYERFGRFHEVMAEDSGQTVLPCLVDSILPLAPGLVERLRAGIDVLDAGCGRGMALMQMAEEFPASRFTGYDLSEEAAAWARAEAERRGLANVTFEARDLSDFDERADQEAFDLVTTFDAVHDQARPGALLAGIRRTLRPGGTYLMQDIHASSKLHENLDHPAGPMLYAISTMHCMTVSLAQGGEGLGTMWGREKALEMLEAAGFGNVEIHRLDHDFQNDYYVIRA